MIEQNKISIIIVTYDSINDIDNCLKSIFKQTIQPFEIIVVDNQSLDLTAEYIQNQYPDVRVIINSINAGFGGGNNLGVAHARGELIVFLNPDTIVSETWLEALIKPLLSSEKIITTSKILTYDGRMINTCGNIIHFTGLAFTRGYGSEPASFNKYEYVDEASGCSFAVRKDDFVQIGGFDPNIFLYHDDVDFSLRTHLKKFKILYVPDSVVKHDYSLVITPKKLYYLEKGRYTILKKYYSTKMLLLISPSLFIAEILSSGYAIKLGKEGIIQKIKAIKDGLQNNIDRKDLGDTNLFKLIGTCIPSGNISKNKIELFVINMANKIFMINIGIIK